MRWFGSFGGGVSQRLALKSWAVLWHPREKPLAKPLVILSSQRVSNFIVEDKRNVNRKHIATHFVLFMFKRCRLLEFIEPSKIYFGHHFPLLYKTSTFVVSGKSIPFLSQLALKSRNGPLESFEWLYDLLWHWGEKDWRRWNSLSTRTATLQFCQTC